MLQSRHLGIDLPDVQLVGDLLLPAGAKELVAFVHGSGSSRSSPRNQHMARYLSERAKPGHPAW